jgi:hypothetical protein
MSQQFKLEKKVDGVWLDMTRKDGLEGINRFKTVDAARSEGLVILTKFEQSVTFRVTPIPEIP